MATLDEVNRNLSDKKMKDLTTALTQIERAHGKGSIMWMGDDAMRVEIASISTGAINLDAAIGIGGIPRGRITEIYGPESSGKTTLCLHVIANAQRAGGIAAFIDAEHALDVTYSRRLGVDVDNLLVSQPDTGEQALEIAEVLIRSNAIDLVVIDSVAALVPRAEIEGEMGDSHVGLQARLMSQALRKLTGAVARSRTSVIFTNQIREKNRGHVRQSRNDAGGSCTEVLCLLAIGYSAYRRDQGWTGYHREPDTRKGREEQVCSPVPAGRIRHPLQRRDQPREPSHRNRCRGGNHREIRVLVFVWGSTSRTRERKLAGLPERESGCVGGIGHSRSRFDRSGGGSGGRGGRGQALGRKGDGRTVEGSGGERERLNQAPT